MKRCLLLGFALALPTLSFIEFSGRAEPRERSEYVQDKKQEPIPHGQSEPPGPPLSPQEAVKKMSVPPGFHVELVAAEPDIINPVAMTFDERGRIWITESIEYPRHAPGPGKDRVKVLESTKGDGKFDKITTVIEGLNIPSGIAVGQGGVWVANSPDILFYPFEDFATLKLAKPQAVVSGFGRSDTHELPNSLTWGPDGWLYGLNGVFNPSHVKHKGKDYKFTCAMFRIHPETKEFEVFCEGTSNPWGIAFNENGDAFVSACVIDHLWHLVETGYYLRQGGPYPPYTWKIGSIVKHRHQKAAYCGITWFDSDAYPREYRGKLYMGNIHGGAINCDEVIKDGATYLGRPALSAKPQAGKAPGVGEGSNFLLANDAWFMPVAQKTGPDGCLYVLDWYDRYHCYQDAGRDPKGIDRERGRLYRVVYGDYKPAGKFDLSTEGHEKLLQRLSSPNVFFRDYAQQKLIASSYLGPNDIREAGSEARMEQLRKLVRDPAASRKARLHALWVLIGANCWTPEWLEHPDPIIRAWAVRGAYYPEQSQRIAELHKDPSPDVQLQVAIAARKCTEVNSLSLLLDVVAHCGDDKLIPHIVWQNLHPLLEKDGERFLTLAGKVELTKSPGLAKVLPRAIDRILGNQNGDPVAVAKFIDKLFRDKEKLPRNKQSDETVRLCLTALTVKMQNNEITGKQLDALRTSIKPTLKMMMSHPHSSVDVEAAILLTLMKDADGISATRKTFAEFNYPEDARLRSLAALIAAGDGKEVLALGEPLLRDKRLSANFRGGYLAALASFDDPGVAVQVLRSYAGLEPELQPRAIELLTQRPAWAKALLKSIADDKIAKDVVNINQVRRLLSVKDAELTKLIEKHWGTPRDSRNPEREKVVADMKELFRKTPGDAKAGRAVFKKLCAQCHKIHGEGVDVGPDITNNGRADFDQLLSNVFDPSLVIGAGYQTVRVNTRQGQVVSGLIVEDNKERVVLKVQGGELKTIARKDVEEQVTSKLSMMPEDLEKQLRPQEIVDLLNFLSLDRPPDDPRAKRIPGTPR